MSQQSDFAPLQRQALFVLAASVLFVRSTLGDIVRLRNGGELRGQLGNISAEALSITTDTGTLVTVPTDQVHFFVRRSPLQDEFERRFAAAPSNSEAHWELGQWAKQNR